MPNLDCVDVNDVGGALHILEQFESIWLTFVAHIPIHHLHRNCREIIILYRYTSHFIIEIQTKRSTLLLLQLLSFAASILTNFLEGQSDAQTMGFPYPTFGK